MSGLIAERVAALPFSGIRKFFDVVQTIPGAISLGVGEPDFETPWRIREQAIYHLERRKTAYTSNAGTIELREAISDYMRRFNLSYDPKTEILVTVGASEGIDIALRALVNPGDEVVYVEPCYVSYRPCIVMAGATPVPVAATAENDFRVTPGQLKAAITPKTKAVLLSYPGNPTGAVLEREDAKALAAFLSAQNLAVITDEIYAELTYTGQRHVSLAEFPGMREKTIVLNGFSKAFAMTGWRLGYVCAPPEILSAMLKIHQYVLMCASTTAQFAGIEALKNCADNVEAMRQDYNRRRRVVLEGFRQMGLPCFEPLGAFYAFPDIRATGMSSEAFCNALLQEEKLAVVPGTAFGESGEGFVRCSYAYSIDQLTEALSRLTRFLSRHI